ncbi:MULTISPECIES: response regulator transcription factor [unclassified Bradyrhizobium]|uniref:response regulator transcription factor n=1 Tax=unclassified Bradyrhizobium TaxID=2631580 RepID=UPI0003FCA02A|nr:MULTISPECIES: response regulator transcription factor [unclassified Bradyrhizobium]MCP3464054.1 response regulator transcription factor [Bradyrhizobium sp. CCGUVB23]
MRILIVEDDLSLVKGLKKALTHAGVAVDHEASGTAAIEIAPSEAYSLIILDLGLPDLPGQEVLRRLRNNGCEVPILILTALGEVKDKVRCFNLGADDYLTKPFDLDEFEARVKALVRRGKGRLDPVLKCGALMFETSSATATLAGKPLILRRREVTVLEILMSHAGRLVRKERLISEVFGFDEPVAPNAIELYIARLRQKLAPDGPMIKTVRGLGYLMEDR